MRVRTIYHILSRLPDKLPRDRKQFAPRTVRPSTYCGFAITYTRASRPSPFETLLQGASSLTPTESTLGSRDPNYYIRAITLAPTLGNGLVTLAPVRR
jgi:hypothetical protein